MKLIISLIFVAATVVAPGESIPPHNRERGDIPGTSSAVEGAGLLLKAFAANDPSVAADFFFPADAFDLVKDLPVPGRYHRKLVRWYEEDIKEARGRFASGEWKIENVELGRCRWKEPGTEGNKVAYWSCRGNVVTARTEEKTRRFEINVLINWGERWYVTHLGPIRK